MHWKRLPLVVVLVFSFQCGGASAPRVTFGTPKIDTKERTVTAATGDAHLTFRDRVLWVNGPQHTATAAIALPSGRYSLEAEDDTYHYFRAPGRISLQRVEGGQAVGGEDLPGGVAVAKAPFNPIQAVAYVDVRSGVKRHALRLGESFLKLEGRDWFRTD